MDSLNDFALGSAHLEGGRFAEAVGCLGRVLGLEPDHAEAQRKLGLALHGFGSQLVRNGQWDQAVVCFRLALPYRPEAALYVELGDVLQAQGLRQEAIVAFEKAVALEPEGLDALLRLGAIYAAVNQAGPASKWYRWALALDPDLLEANFNLAALLEGQARLAEAQIHKKRLPRPLPLVVETAPEERLRVLVPWGAGSGNVPIDTLMPRATTTRIKWFVECSTDEQEAQLPPFDVVFNGIGNADLAGFSLARLTAFQARQPMLNPPDRVMRTRRDRMPELLGDLPGVLVPPVARLDRAEALEADLEARLAGQGLTLPLLVRPISTQGGKGAVKVAASGELPGAVASDADAFYFIGFHDFHSADGCYRKYRMIYVDRRPYPYHLAIADAWLVHYQTAHMRELPWKREEERRFLEDPRAALGEGPYRALEAIGRRLDLDYGGIDFTVLPDGRILVFEANATMLVHLEEDAADHPDKHVAVPAIYRAFDAMLERARRHP